MARRANSPQKQQELITFGRRLKMWRKKRGMTQEKLATLAGIDYTHYNELENAKVEPGLIILLKLAKALNISAAVFFLYKPEAEKVAFILGQADLSQESL